MGHFGLKIEAENDETLSQYFQNMVRRYQSSLLDLRHPDIYKNPEILVILNYLKIMEILRTNSVRNF
jgi:hypothetical protein